MVVWGENPMSREKVINTGTLLNNGHETMLFNSKYLFCYETKLLTSTQMHESSRTTVPKKKLLVKTSLQLSQYSLGNSGMVRADMLIL